MKLMRSAMLVAATGALIAVLPPVSASAQTAQGKVPVTCTKPGHGKTSAWMRCKGTGQARLEYKCKAPFFNRWHSAHGKWHTVKKKKYIKIVAECNHKIKDVGYATRRVP